MFPKRTVFFGLQLRTELDQMKAMNDALRLEIRRRNAENEKSDATTLMLGKEVRELEEALVDQQVFDQ
jgi:hypothetical protein